MDDQPGDDAEVRDVRVILAHLFEQPRRRHWRILTFNVCPGSPLSMFGVGVPALYDSRRLRDLVHKIAVSRAHIVCLQEVFGKHLRDDIAKSLEQFYTPVPIKLQKSAATRLGKLLFFALVVAVFAVGVGVFMLCAHIARMALSAPETIAVVIGTVFSLLFIVVMFGRIGDPVGSWLTDNSAGLMVLYKKESPTEVKTEFKQVLFDESSPLCGGDPLNRLHRRGYVFGELYLDAQRTQSIAIVNTHLNALGQCKWRVQQMQQIKDSVLQNSRGAPLLICADTNADVGSETMKFIGSEIGHAATSGIFHTWSPSYNLLAREWLTETTDMSLDYVISCGDEKPSIRDCEVHGRFPPVSDHFGLSVVFELKTK